MIGHLVVLILAIYGPPAAVTAVDDLIEGMQQPQEILYIKPEKKKIRYGKKT